MKLQTIIYTCLLFLFACDNKQQNDKVATADPLSQQWFASDTVLVWNCDAAGQTRTRIYLPPDSVSFVQPFINGINKTWPEPILVLIALRSDTVEVTLRNPAWLTGKSGNMGAEQYLSFAALNLLEVKGVNYVYFSMPEGAHAGASVWSNADFADWTTTDTLNNR